MSSKIKLIIKSKKKTIFVKLVRKYIYFLTTYREKCKIFLHNLIKFIFATHLTYTPTNC